MAPVMIAVAPKMALVLSHRFMDKNKNNRNATK